MEKHIFTIPEVQADLDATNLDVKHLQAVVEGLRGFIQHSYDADRTAFKADLFKYEGLLQRGQNLQLAITNKLHELKNP